MAIPTTPPSGFRDFLPDAAAVRAHAAEVIAGVYRSFGFQRIATSAFEDLAVLLGKARGEGIELADMGLRFDLTVPLARYYSKYGTTLPHPFKAFQLGPVWRAERAQKGRFREFWQCDADVIGSDAWHCEVEVISALVTAVTRLGVEHPKVLINDR